MERIRCPHCGAMNQDVTLKDACWQCGKVLGDAPSEDAPPLAKETPVKLTLEERVAARKAAKAQRSAVPTLVAIVLLLLVLLVVLFLLHPWR